MLGQADALDERSGRATYLAAIGQHDQFFLCLGLDFCTPHVEGLELVDELVDDVPQPLFRKLQ